MRLGQCHYLSSSRVITRTLRWISTTMLQLKPLVYHCTDQTLETKLRWSDALLHFGRELHYCLRQIWSWYFYSDFWSLKASLFYFLPQKSVPIWLHSETLVSCPVNLVRNCCFIEAIFSLNNNQTLLHRSSSALGEFLAPLLYCAPVALFNSEENPEEKSICMSLYLWANLPFDQVKQHDIFPTPLS